MNEKLTKEINLIFTPEFKLGKYIYMGMGLVGAHRVCLSVAYKVDYCIKKARQFEQVDKNVRFTHINKVKVGDLEACEKFELN